MTRTHQAFLRAAATVAALALGSAAAAQDAPTYTTHDAASQAAMTPDAALAELAAGNRRFLDGETHQRDLRRQALVTSAAQHPFAAVLSCLDSRGAPEIVFDQGFGDIFVGRVAGNVVDELMIGSLEYATAVAGARLIVVMGHTECGAVKAACDGVEMGHITDVVREIVPAVDAVSTPPGTVRTSKNGDFVVEVTRQNAHMQVNEILRRSPIVRDLVDAGKVRIVSALHDIATGAVTFY
jgi:carbonic anhydrase